MTGARLLVPAEDTVVRGALLELEIDGGWATVRVAWVTPAADPSALWCGVMFLLPDDQFMAGVARVMDAANRAAGRRG